MLTSSMHRDVYPAIDPAQNPTVTAEGKVAIVTGATGGLGFVSLSSFPSINSSVYDSIEIFK